MGKEPKIGVPKAKRGEAPQPRRNHIHRIDRQGVIYRLHYAQDNHHHTQRNKCAWKNQAQAHRRSLRRKNKGYETRIFLSLEKQGQPL
jgi:hypothetical protein